MGKRCECSVSYVRKMLGDNSTSLNIHIHRFPSMYFKLSFTPALINTNSLKALPPTGHDLPHPSFPLHHHGHHILPSFSFPLHWHHHSALQHPLPYHQRKQNALHRGVYPHDSQFPREHIPNPRSQRGPSPLRRLHSHHPRAPSPARHRNCDLCLPRRDVPRSDITASFHHFHVS